MVNSALTFLVEILETPFVLIHLLKLGNRAFSSNPGAWALSTSSILLNSDWVGNTFLSNLEIRLLRDVGY